jgi:hypothetical protein
MPKIARPQPSHDRNAHMDINHLRRKARYGHKAYLYWRSEDGAFCWAPYDPDGIKRAIIGSRHVGRFYWFDEAGNSNIARSLDYQLYLWRCAGSRHLV